MHGLGKPEREIMRQARFGYEVTRRDFLRVSSAGLAGWAVAGSRWADAVPERGIRFGLVTDSHFAEREPAGIRYYRESLRKMNECVALMNEKKADFLVELGDFKDQGDPPAETRTLEFLEHIEDAFAKFEGPRYHVLGNHDMDSISKAQFLGAVQNAGIARGRSYYSFDRKGVHFVVLDANFRDDGSDYDHGNFKWTEPNVPQAELDWLRQNLADAEGPVVAFVHQRLDGEGDVFVTNAEQVRAVLEGSGKVLAVFQGHHHEGAITEVNGIHYYTLKAMVEGAETNDNAYAIADLDAEGAITVTGYRRAVSSEFSAGLQPVQSV